MQLAKPINSEEQQITKDIEAKVNKRLSTIFVVFGIVSFAMSAYINWYTIKKINSGSK